MSKSLENKKVAIVCDWIKDWGGAEIVLVQLLEAFPEADIFTSIFYQKNNSLFEGRKITTSFIQKIPLLNKSHKAALMLRPQAFESFDLSSYDIVISSTSAESKGVITKPDCLQICYCHTPTRYFWSHYHEYINMMEFGILNPLAKWLMPKVVHKLRTWDYCAAQRPDFFLANSKNTATRIAKYYNRDSEVLYPCIDASKFPFSEEKKDYYLYVGRAIPYKKFDLVVDAFNTNGKKLIIITNTPNKLYKELKSKSGENIEWKLCITREETKKLFSEAKAFLFPPEEDFGLVPIEAMLGGTPVIAYGKGGALETVKAPHPLSGTSPQKEEEYTTGLFFKEQTPESLNSAIDQFETLKFDPKKIREHALRFDKKVFIQKLKSFIEKKLNERT